MNDKEKSFTEITEELSGEKQVFKWAVVRAAPYVKYLEDIEDVKYYMVAGWLSSTYLKTYYPEASRSSLSWTAINNAMTEMDSAMGMIKDDSVKRYVAFAASKLAYTIMFTGSDEVLGKIKDVHSEKIKKGCAQSLRSKKIIEKIMEYLSSHPKRPVNIAHISKTTGIDRRTIKKYL